jgi:Trk K+ transport system NAD-binding subunit
MAERQVLCGLSRLTVRVAEALRERGAEVVVVAPSPAGPLARRVASSARVVDAADDWREALSGVGLEGAAALLALGDDDLENLQAVVAGTALAPGVPVVLRAFDPALADQLGGRIRLRRAFSVSALAAPAFVAAAFGSEVVETMRLGEDAVPLARVRVHPCSPLVGLTPREMKAEFGCAVFAVAEAGAGWEPVLGSGRTVREGSEVMVGGPIMQLLALIRSSTAPPRAEAPRVRRARRREDRRRLPSLVPAAAFMLLGILVLTVVVYALALHLGPIGALYAAITTAFGNPTLDKSDDWLKVFGVSSMIVGGILVGILFAHVTALATSDWLDQRTSRLVSRLDGHAIVAGLGNVGYRIEQLLSALGVPVAALDRSPDPRFVDAVGERTPVVSGDIRLAENLERAGVDRAAWVFATTDADLSNLEACAQARRANPDIVTVCRVFDEEFAREAGRMLGLDAILSTTEAAGSAFVSAATDERATRPFGVGDLRFAARQVELAEPLPFGRIESWWQTGVRVLAFADPDGTVHPASELPQELPAGAAVLVAGPEDAVRRTT